MAEDGWTTTNGMIATMDGLTMIAKKTINKRDKLQLKVDIRAVEDGAVTRKLARLGNGCTGLLTLSITPRRMTKSDIMDMENMVMASEAMEDNVAEIGLLYLVKMNILFR